MWHNNINIPISDVQTWLVDFDETLAYGNLTWVLQHSIPKFVQEYELNYDEVHLQQVMLLLQERGRQNPDTLLLLTALFEMMEWPPSLQNQLLANLRSNYRPILFDDTLPFLEQLRTDNCHVYIVSNNKRTPEHLQLLRIHEYISGVFTPHNCPGTQPKPHSSLWTYIMAQEVEIDPQTTAIVGDDPWTDGGFAESCSLSCWIVDRMKRFSKMYSQRPYHWVQSLLDIPIYR
jgi:FMN phosphatase YigB (HAD superfamily)